MPRTLGYHLVKTGYGLWLPGDQRGHWSEAWDEQIGLIEPRTLHPGDPVRQRMAAERMTQPPTKLTPPMMEAAAAAVGACCHDSDWRVVAASIESTHMHLQLTFTPRDIGNTAKWISDQCTKAIRRRAGFEAKVWAKGRWLQYIFDADHWDRLLAYIERHNMRRGLPAKPYPWIR